MSIELSIKEAQKLALQTQGLLSKPIFGKGRKGALNAVKHLGYVQIDAISVIQRAHHHTLWSRVPSYSPQYLFDLLDKDQSIFEYWSHAAAFLPTQDYRFYLSRMQRVASQNQHWYDVSEKTKQHVLDRIKNEGPLFARDFASDGHRSGEMWDTKPAKRALHEFFMAGKLMVKARPNFQRQYDLTERVLPVGINLTKPTDLELGKFIIKNGIRANGLCSLQELTYQQTFLKPFVRSAIEELLGNDQLIALKVAALPKQTYYSTQVLLDSIPKRVSKQLHFLSPFDNAIIQRKRLKQLFDFDYQMEIYLPSHKRVYGYFAMPILWGTEFIGRINPKADRKSKILIIRNLVINEKTKLTDHLVSRFCEKLREFALFNNCDEIIFENVEPNHLKKRFVSLL